MAVLLQFYTSCRIVRKALRIMGMVHSAKHAGQVEPTRCVAAGVAAGVFGGDGGEEADKKKFIKHCLALGSYNVLRKGSGWQWGKKKTTYNKCQRAHARAK